MKNAKKVLLLVLCAVLLVGASVAGTVAYLTDKDDVTNTFTVGKVYITMDEAKTDTAGNALTGADAGRDKTNTYNLIPGHTYLKDPTIHIEAGSENCWVFVEVKNEIAAIEDDVIKIANQITTTNNWTLFHTAGDTSIYYKDWDPTMGNDLVVFSQFKIDEAVTNDTLNGGEGATTGGYNGKSVVVNAYAIQRDALATAEAAWNALNPTP